MYQIRLGAEDMKRFKGICRAMMFKKCLSYQDVADMTGYSVRTIYNFFAKDKAERNSRFVAAALADVLEISVGGQR